MQELSALGCQVWLLNAESKVKYHATCAIASNLICALVAESLELLADCGFSQETALSALAPLLRSNLEHILADGPISSLTHDSKKTKTSELPAIPGEADALPRSFPKTCAFG